MWALVQELIKIYAERIVQDGERYLKTQSLILSLKTLKGARLFILTLVLFVVIGTLCSVSFFSAIYLLLQGYSATGSWILDLPLIFSLSTFAVTGALLFYFSRQQFWMQAFALDKQIVELAGLPQDTKLSLPSLDAVKKDKDLNAKVDKLELLIDKRIQDAVDRALSRGPESPMNH